MLGLCETWFGLLDVEIGSRLRNISVVDLYGNVTVTYHLTEPFVGRTPGVRNVSMTTDQMVRCTF